MSRSTSSALRTVSVVACLILSAAMAHAQYRTSIQGVVTDPTGAVVAGAHLTLTNPATGEKQVRDSNDAGVFNFNALAASVRFRLEVEKDGFQKKVIDNLDLIPEQPNSVTVQLVIGAASTTVTVDATAAPLLDTETASVNGVVSDNQIQHMPSFGRDVFQLIQLAPGVFGDGAQGNGGGAENIPGTQGPSRDRQQAPRAKEGCSPELSKYCCPWGLIRPFQICAIDEAPGAEGPRCARNWPFAISSALAPSRPVAPLVPRIPRVHRWVTFQPQAESC